MPVVAKLGRQDAIALALFLGAAFLAAAIGSIATASSLDPWYADLNKPAWTPPGSVIGSVWTVLYTLIGIAGYLVWREIGWVRSRPYALFGAQLALNALWSVLFFGLRSPALGVAGIVALWIAVLATLVDFWRVSRPAGLLFVPYLAWVTFAGSLNAILWQLNP